MAKNYLDKDGLQDYTTKLVAKLKTILATKSDVGSPLTASTVAGMTDHDKIYVYTGSETGYVNGDWYYWNGSAWADGGQYNSATNIDATLSIAGDAADAKAVGDALDTKADKDGYYEDLSVGRADNIISNISVTDKVPYNYRASGGSLKIGDTDRLEQIVGVTVYFRQMMMLNDTTGLYVKSNVDMSFDDTDKSITITANTSDSGIKNAKFSLTANYSYYLCSYVKKGTGAISASFGIFNSNDVPVTGKHIIVTGDDEEYFECVYKASSGDYIAMRLDDDEVANGSATFTKSMIFNLNRMFWNDSAANYFSSLESGSEGAGCSLFRSYFPKDYYEGASSTDGVLYSVNVSSKKAVGFNAYNHSAGTAKLLADTEYQITGAYSALTFTDVSGNSETITPDASGIFTVGRNGTLAITGGNGTTTCVHRVKDGERNGDFEAYELHEYPLDESLTLSGQITVVNGELAAKGDIYYNDGSVKRVFGFVDLGTLEPAGVNWRAAGSGVGWYYSANDIKVKYVTDGTKANIACSLYTTRTYSQIYNYEAYGISGSKEANYGRVYIRQGDATLTTKAKVKAAMQGVYLVWEKYSATNESADAYQETQVVDNWGTEELVDYSESQGLRDVSVPCGHVTEYPQDLKAKIESAPDSPSADGQYVMQRTNGQNTYAPHVRELPTLPDTAGTYVLECIVDNEGNPSLSWVERT